MVRAVVGNAAFRIIVPDMAKSAGTLMTFGADQILMSDTSELGPIDPQIPHVGASDELRRLSVLTYIKADEEWKDALDANGNDVTACIMMSKLDPATLRHYRFVAGPQDHSAALRRAASRHLLATAQTGHVICACSTPTSRFDEKM